MTPDVNVLVAASRSDHPHHKPAVAWLHGAIADADDGAALVLMPMVLASLLRLVTSPKIFNAPTPMADAVAFVDAILAAPGVQLGTLGPEWPLLRQQCLDGKLAANAVPDAWLAAAVQHSGEHLVSFDRDFKSCSAARGSRTWCLEPSKNGVQASASQARPHRLRCAMADPIRYLTKSRFRLQFEDLPGARREAMKRALLRYCELDRLAMVMAVQALMDVARA